MIYNNILYIASNSSSRKRLLAAAQIPFFVIHQDADESKISLDQSLYQIVQQLAQFKMEHAQIPEGMHEGQVCFVLTADTLGQVMTTGRVLTKPIDRDDAISMLQQARSGTLTVTGFCLRKMIWVQGVWSVMEEVVDYDQAESIFDVPDFAIDFYLQNIPFLSVSGAISIEEFGGQFLKKVDGNYETIVGLPMFKLRQALEKLNFYL